MESLKHLFNWDRLKSAAWVFGGGVVASVLFTLSTANVLSLTWGDLKVALITAVITQVTKAVNNATSGYAAPY